MEPAIRWFRARTPATVLFSPQLNESKEDSGELVPDRGAQFRELTTPSRLRALRAVAIDLPDRCSLQYKRPALRITSSVPDGFQSRIMMTSDSESLHTLLRMRMTPTGHAFRLGCFRLATAHPSSMISDYRVMRASGNGRFCCKSRLRQATNRDSVTLTRISARSIHDGPSEE